MALLTEAKKTTTGQKLNSIIDEATIYINRLKDLKTEILALKTAIQANTTLYSAADVTELTSAITELNNNLKSI